MSDLPAIPQRVSCSTTVYFPEGTGVGAAFSSTGACFGTSVLSMRLLLLQPKAKRPAIDKDRMSVSLRWTISLLLVTWIDSPVFSYPFNGESRVTLILLETLSNNPGISPFY